MFRLACALLIATIGSALPLAGALPARPAQADVSGRWRIDPAPERFPWTAVLRVYGTRVIGAVSSSTLTARQAAAGT